ncbi:alginate export family protein [Polaribacter sp. MSW13]|uniref:Alginate export family protein n=1 Tax=Polaribacter marinus TaxID=2916838 RepID=A0A9X1VM60_9FLAO|nr:alginate export family protein [Polaribacter marinus]MCI2228113.1 alginate export family protein [Polaribacter marinus]
MKKGLFFTVFTLFFTVLITAQTFQLTSEIRPRFENRHGYKTLMYSGDEGASFISQRTRLNFNFQQEKLMLGISLQNIRVWGDVSTLTSNDNANSFHQAWAKYQFTDKFSLKFGRQEIVYDDSRIFGNVGWAQQARSFDAVVAQIKTSEKGELDIGYSLNNDSEQLINSLYTNVAGYKTFQYAWYHTEINKFGLSFLILNNGVEFLNSNLEEELNYSQTFGSRATYSVGKFSLDGAIYFQTGKILDNSVFANYFGGNIGYKVFNEFQLRIGVEYLSGKDMNDMSNKVKSFNPIFGTNHKFNGFMDYFYVGNHMNSVGLLDLNTTIAYAKNRFSAKIIPHLFSSTAAIYNGSSKLSNNLGIEVDIALGYKFSKNVTLNAGFSKMFGTSSLEFLKGGNRSTDNSWTWLMITFTPKLFASN